MDHHNLLVNLRDFFNFFFNFFFYEKDIINGEGQPIVQLKNSGEHLNEPSVFVRLEYIFLGLGTHGILFPENPFSSEIINFTL